MFSLLLFCISAACHSTLNAEEIKLGGGGATYHTILAAMKNSFEKTTGINLTLLQSTPKTIFLELLDNKLDAIVIAIPLEGIVDQVKKDGINVESANFTTTHIGSHKTVVILNKDNPIQKLSKQQLKDIFTGKSTNWKDVGGKNEPIMIVWTNVAPGTNNLFIKEILDNEQPTKELLQATDAINIKEMIASTNEAIGLLPLGIVDDTIKTPEAPSINSKVLIVTKNNPPSTLMQKFIDYMKGDGQKFVK